MIDLYIADATAWVMANGLWLAAAGAAAGTAYLAGRYATPAWMRRRISTLGRANKALRADNRRLLHALAEADAATAGARLIAVIERDNAVAAVQYAVNAEKKLQALSDGLACAEMELQWEEER